MMSFFVMPYLAIDPIAFEIGPLQIRWYGLAYMAGILLGWQYCRHLIKSGAFSFKLKMMDDFIIWATIGIVAGGRLGQVLFYNFDYYSHHPLEVFMLWKPGMSFHGGLLGVVIAMLIYCRKNKLHAPSFMDMIACGAPFGLFFGRLANYINAELVGRASDVPWATIFPGSDGVPRHPSQLYEAGLEGLLLFAILHLLIKKGFSLKNPGFILSSFLFFYGLFRFLVEFVREPDAQIGYYLSFITQGQLLSLPLMIFGVIYGYKSIKNKKTDTHSH
ncbi:MAG: prolipoprotein diacylglyceryl transferase [Alphaproteobacteria bacterium]|nr:prolipoprotein diacylglyceryl transferase [Alphaproteobacteria bacterium]